MAEIKSTLELAMERTKRFGISEEEREEIKQKEFLQKVVSIFNRYKEGSLSLNEILREIEKVEEETRKKLKDALVSKWIDALSLKEEDERFLKGIETLKEQDMEGLKEKFNLLFSQFLKEKAKTFQKVKSQLEEEFKSEGIWGSAVEANVEASKLWERISIELDHRYMGKLEEIKDELRIL